jgi:hypothetical protein
MAEQIYNLLKIPKTIEELQFRLNDAGIDWNKSQVELFLLLDKNIKQKNGNWQLAGSYQTIEVFKILDRLFEKRPKIPVTYTVIYPSEIKQPEMGGFDERRKVVHTGFEPEDCS